MRALKGRTGRRRIGSRKLRDLTNKRQAWAWMRALSGVPFQDSIDDLDMEEIETVREAYELGLLAKGVYDDDEKGIDC